MAAKSPGYHQMGHWWPHNNSLTETGNGMRGQKLKPAWAKAESQATPEGNVSWPQTLESRAALSPLRRRNCQIVFGISPECDLELLEELVHPGEQGLGGVGSGLYTRAALKHNHPVSQVGGHDEVVLDNKAGLLGVQDEPLDHLGGHQSLLGVQVGTGLINKVDICGLP